MAPSGWPGSSAARLERIHLPEYAVVTWLAWRAIDPDGRRGRRGYALALLLAVAIGWGEELLQRFVPGRVYDLRDVAANALGALLGLLVLIAFRAGAEPAPPALNAGS